MTTPNVLAIHDISCVGKCSLTVALPILSAKGVECRLLPTGLLSTHTGGFAGYTFLDLTDEMRKILRAWEPLNLHFDGIYSGYLGSPEQIDLVKEVIASHPEAKVYVDPVMADGGKLYPGFDEAFVEKMRELLPFADVLMPNITEACFLTNTPYSENSEPQALVKKLQALGAKHIVLTGFSTSDNTIGAMTSDGSSYETERIGGSYHGTGDIFGSVLVSHLAKGATLQKATHAACDFVVSAIKATPKEADKRYGVNFEAILAEK
ncbi:MAG: pyridoxamine kinase [Streptococcaceae bacterium]|jgi:pyridoxine kinase|nr:pyridoxamine kinase [Streptococcaceae bacterium]